MNDIKNKLKNFIATNLIIYANFNELSDDFNLLEAGLDSLGMMRLVDFIEREFGVELEDVDVMPANMKTLFLIEQLVSKKRYG